MLVCLSSQLNVGISPNLSISDSLHPHPKAYVRNCILTGSSYQGFGFASDQTTAITTIGAPGGGGMPPTPVKTSQKRWLLQHAASFASHRAPSDKFLDPLLNESIELRDKTHVHCISVEHTRSV